MTNTSAAIKVHQLTKTYGKGANKFTALKDVSLQIATGESIAILGKSGSGKSTLMHLLALLDSPTHGTIQINGVDTHSLKTGQVDELRNQQFGFVFQQFFLNASASVLDNVTLPLKIAGVNRQERISRGMAALKAVELEDKAKNRANDLSGGQKQRVVIARALINNPKIIFADEPTGNLDTATGAKIESLLFKLNQEQNISIVIVTHDPELAKRCDRRIEIKDGEIVQESK